MQPYPAVEIGARFRIVDAIGSRCGGDRIDLILERGAFGSGEHETTASCMEVVEDLGAAVNGARVLDLGSGTGVLSIAALLLGAASATCVDLSPEAVAVARSNCRRNRVDGRVTHVEGRLEDVKPREFDLILANIYADVLLDEADGLVERAAPGAHLVLSGIPWQDNYDVRRRYTDLGCEIVRNRMGEEFGTMLMRFEARWHDRGRDARATIF